MMNEPCEDRKEHESKKLRLVRDLFVLSDELDCGHLDMDVSDEMNWTTTHESTAKTMQR